MTKVEAVVIRERVETVIDAVEAETGHVGVTVVEAIGHGRQRGVTHEYRGRVFESRFLPKALLTFVVEDSRRTGRGRGDRRRGAVRPRVRRRDRLDDPDRERHAQPHRACPRGGGGRMKTADLVIAVNTVWVVVAAVLVMFMQAGFAFLEAGLTRMKNAAHIAGKNVLIFGVCSIVYWAVGFGIAFGDGNALIGTSGFFPSSRRAALDRRRAVQRSSATIPGVGGLPVRGRLRGVSLAIVWGAMAERAKLWVYFVFGAFFTVIYSVVSHWIWHSGGWLFSLGMQDFAGSTVVHYQGALAALAGALLLGPRIGKFGHDGRANPIPGHNMPYAVLGTLILWFGWFGFNAGSTLGVVTGDQIGYFAYVALTTNLAAAAGALGGIGVSVARAPQAGRVDDAERRDRGAGGDHSRVGLRRAVGRGRDRRRSQARSRSSACSGSSGSASTTRSARSPCTGWPACGERSRRACSPSPRWRRTSLRAPAASSTRAASTSSACRHSASSPSARSRSARRSRVSGALKRLWGIRVEEHVETAGLDVAEHGMWGYPEFYIPVPGGYGTESHSHLIGHGHRREPVPEAVAEEQAA